MITLSQKRIIAGTLLFIFGIVLIVKLAPSSSFIKSSEGARVGKAALVSDEHTQQPIGFEAMYVPTYESSHPEKKQGWFGGKNSETEDVEMGETIMSELGNATIKAELGRASWRVIHTVCARYPLKPSADQQEALRKWIYLFSRLHPCGQCARHFQGVLVNNPPKVGTRQEASQWACDVHNIVNTRLNKPQFNCSTVLDHWQCGCAESDH